MSGGKETPRQKMIGMMYLVLTALLALNVAKSVLDAFTLVDEGLSKTTENFAKKNSSYYSDFEAAYQLNKTKVADWKSKAEEVKKRSDELYNLLYDCKKEIVIKSEGEETEAIHDNEVHLLHVNGKDNNNIPSEIMIFNKRGIEVKEAITDYREFLISLIDDKETYESVITTIKSTLDTSDPKPDEESKGEQHTWEVEHFEHLPLASVITILSKMQSDVRNAEADILAYLLSQIDAGSFAFNKIDAVVLANSDYVFRGQEYKAQVFLAAYDSTKFPQVVLNDGTELPVEDGKGVYKPSTSSLGSRKWGGTILVDQGNGNVIKREFQAMYQVAEASAVVSPTKMNVFYRGVPNPVAISVSGVPEENIDATITKGRISRSGGNWSVMPAAGKEGEVVKISVFATVDGNRRNMGTLDFRVKDVPPPVAEIAGRSQGAISLTDLTKAPGVSAELKNFDFDLEFTVTEFTVSAVLSGGFTKSEKSSNNKFTSAQMGIISQLGPGKTLTVTDIKAIGPDGKVRSLNSIVMKII